MKDVIYSSKQDLEIRQLELLNQLLGEVLASNPFYQKKADSRRKRNLFTSVRDFTRLFPLTTKAEWVADQETHPPYGTNLTYPISHYTRCHQTSGTSGTPMRWLDTATTWNFVIDDWIEVMRAAELQQSDRFFFAFSFGPFLGFWAAFEAALKLGGFCLSGGGMSTETRLQAMISNEITVLACTPTYALRMGEVAAELGIDREGLPLRCILVAGEPGGSQLSVRQRLAELWPTALVFDHHGMTETGPVSFQCPNMPGVLHLIDSSYLAEVVDLVTLLPVAPGERGELILTTLRRAGSPLIRYRTGDLVELRKPGSCGCRRNHTALTGGIIGRCDDMTVVRGVNVYPSAIDEIIRSTGGVAEYQVQVSEHRSLVELTIRIEVQRDAPSSSAVVQNLERELQKRLALRVPVEVVPGNSLPRFEMKARRWVKECQPT
ncbi:MAG: Phenylacetate-coenzyme A ligase [Verrucomicrobia subdivision 3 bacterium]|nr:Phenylacetate-coenzyme A ligase [Limisphaerales bacterium]MCS1414618.1 Phenylacetate-coenzyme A ligase [Limisphaerales bacterium]